MKRKRNFRDFMYVLKEENLYVVLYKRIKFKLYWVKEAKRLEREYADIPEEPICAEYGEGKNMEKFKDEIDEVFEEYVEFMYNSENIHNCENCPENIGCDSWGGNLPCGQQRCCVECHCESLES